MNEAPPEHPVLAAILDVGMRPFRSYRQRVISKVEGNVLEVGVGTGMNFPYYRPPTRVVGLEPDPHMLHRAKKKARSAQVPIELVQCGAEKMPFNDHTFDAAVLTWVLCTIPNPQAALAEVVRVLRPGAQIYFAEHGRSAHALTARVQHLINPVWSRLAGGCHLTRNGVQLLRDAGFTLREVEPVGAQRFTLLPTTLGQATRPA